MVLILSTRDEQQFLILSTGDIPSGSEYKTNNIRKGCALNYEVLEAKKPGKLKMNRKSEKKTVEETKIAREIGRRRRSAGASVTERNVA